jgi:hypothetical protein
MTKQNRFNKKDLKKRLVTIMMIYMDGLSDKKKEQLNKYTTEKLEPIVNYYVSLLKKKKRKKMDLPPLPQANLSTVPAVNKISNENQ